MEGRWSGAALAATALVSCALALMATGCGDNDGASAGGAHGVRTANPERTFAPLVELAPDEPWRPMSARWFIEHAVLWFAEDQGCEDRKIAVGRTLPEQQNPTIDWIYPKGLGVGPTYYRNPYDEACDLDSDLRFDADQLTRPNDPGPRIEGARPGEGFYLDLVDERRGGPDMRGEVAVPAYAERTDEGDSRLRLTYWLLFGADGVPGEANAHEGDWERIDLLLSEVAEATYRPVGVRSGQRARAAWRATRKVHQTHPVLRLERATHTPAPARPGKSCVRCVRWRTWRSLADARRQLWYGFGGAWGELGDSSARTGPLGPHRFFPSAAEKQRELAELADR